MKAHTKKIGRAEYQGRWDYHIGKDSCPYKANSRNAKLWAIGHSSESREIKIAPMNGVEWVR